MKSINLFLTALIVLGFFALPVSASGAGVTIKDLKVTSSNGQLPMKVGITGTAVGDISKAEYKVINSDTGEIECATDVECGKCVNEGICSRHCIVSHAGTYDVVMIAYDSEGNKAIKLLSNAITVKGKVPPEETEIAEVVKEEAVKEVKETPAIKEKSCSTGTCGKPTCNSCDKKITLSEEPESADVIEEPIEEDVPVTVSEPSCPSCPVCECKCPCTMDQK